MQKRKWKGVNPAVVLILRLQLPTLLFEHLLKLASDEQHIPVHPTLVARKNNSTDNTYFLFYQRFISPFKQNYIFAAA
jgi:hypothetical protein